MSSARSLGAAALNKITPECVNIGKSIKMSSTVVLAMIIIALILLISAIIYNYVKKTDSTDTDAQHENENKKKKVVGGLSITGTVLVFITALASIWDLSVVSKAANRCILAQTT